MNRRPMPWPSRAALAVLAIVISLGVARSLAAADREPGSGKDPMSQPTAERADAFARALYARLAARGGNIVVSPASIEACMSLALAGSRGQTAVEIAEALQLPRANEIDVGKLLDRLGTRSAVAPSANASAGGLVIANSAWVQQGFPIHDAYRKLLSAAGRATFEMVDFASDTETARRTINAWVDERTRHKIRQLLSPDSLDNSARLVLANAIYFKGQWARPFEKNATRDQSFHRPGLADVSVPLMHSDSRFRYSETDAYQAIELPYTQRDVAMVVWLPKRAEALAEVEREITSVSVVASLEQLATTRVELFLPRFKMETSAALARPLAELGMKDAFTPAADFSGISEQPLWISLIVHQALVDVDEVGTEAAAATATVARAAAALPDPADKKVFRADHPFLFAIRDRASGDILFIGRVVSPAP